MALSFQCGICRKVIHVPDGSEGKKTRCPGCYSIIKVPFSGSVQLIDPDQVAPLEDADDPLGISGKTESRWEPSESEPAVGSNPFAADPVALPHAEAPVDTIEMRQAMLRRRRSTLATLSIVLVAIGLLFLIFNGLSVTMQLIRLIDESSDDMGRIAALCGSIVILGAQIITLFALNEVRLFRSYSTARTGMILAMIPFTYPAMCLVLPLGLAVWGMMLLSDNDVCESFHSEGGPGRLNDTPS
ncbi:hypothetical protein [Bremerella cremea]|uniref:hypothetical protein n=1 Tax=Bremerella cremea TaxID=1031537 RepID=UPI0031F07C8E